MRTNLGPTFALISIAIAVIVLLIVLVIVLTKICNLGVRGKERMKKLK